MVNTTFSDVVYSTRALQTANSSTVYTSPNPSVGAVIVADSRIIGEGFTQEDGGPHAEVMAFRAVKKEDLHLLKKSTVYVTLEPCSIFGRTPPCCDLLVKHQVKRVVVGCIDFTPGVLGEGLERLRNAGIEVVVGVQQDLAFEASKFRQAMTRKHRPYIILKQAVSQDGYVGLSDRQVALTGKMANTISHQWRSRVDAILVGANTVDIDDPALTTRLVAGRSPARVILDPQGRSALSKQVFAKAKEQELPTYWAVDSAFAKTCEAAVNALGYSGVVVLPLSEKTRIESLLDLLLKCKVGRLLVEGGPTTLRYFVEADAYDEYYKWTSEVRLEGHATAIAAAQIPGKNVRSFSVGKDSLRVTRKV